MQLLHGVKRPLNSHCIFQPFRTFTTPHELHVNASADCKEGAVSQLWEVFDTRDGDVLVWRLPGTDYCLGAPGKVLRDVAYTRPTTHEEAAALGLVSNEESIKALHC